MIAQKISKMIGKSLALIMFFCLLGGYAHAEPSFKLTAKAWDMMAAQKYDEALAAIDLCVKLYGEEAKKMQTSLTALPTGTQEQVSKYWALNDVCTCLFIKGQVLEKKGDTKGAIEAYKQCAELSYGQCWDTKGWFWQPGQAAKKKIIELGFDDE